MEFDPLKLKKRIEDNEACTSISLCEVESLWIVNKVAWYM